MSDSTPNFSLFDTILVSIARNFRLFLFVLISIMGGFTAYAFLVKPEYESHCVFEVRGASNDMLGLSKMGMLGSLMNSTGDESTTQLLVSREIQVAIIEKFGLKKKWKSKTMAAALKRLEKYYLMSVVDEDYFQISFFHTHPDSARMAVQFVVDHLQEKQQRLRKTYAQNQFNLYQGVLDRQLVLMDSLSDSIVHFMKHNQVLEIQTQAEQIMRGVADIDKEILQTTVELKTLYENFWNKGNSDYNALVKKIAMLQEYRKQIMQGQSGRGGSNQHLPEFKRIPELGQQMKIMENKMEFQQGVLMYLIPQLERYRLEITDTTSRITMLDPPYTPDYKARPKRLYILMAGAFISVLFSILFATGFALATMPELANTSLPTLIRNVTGVWKNGSKSL